MLLSAVATMVGHFKKQALWKLVRTGNEIVKPFALWNERETPNASVNEPSKQIGGGMSLTPSHGGGTRITRGTGDEREVAREDVLQVVCFVHCRCLPVASRQAEERSKWRRLERAEDDEDRRGEEEEEAAAKRALKKATEPEENEAMDVATSLVEEQPFRSETSNEPLSYEASSIVIKTAPLQRRRHVFAHEEEEDLGQRRLISIQCVVHMMQMHGQHSCLCGGTLTKLRADRYSEAEKKGLLEEPEAREESKPPSAPPAVESAAESRKRIMSMIPKDSASVLEYPLQWKYLDNPPRDVSERIKGEAMRCLRRISGSIILLVYITSYYMTLLLHHAQLG